MVALFFVVVLFLKGKESAVMPLHFHHFWFSISVISLDVEAKKERKRLGSIHFLPLQCHRKAIDLIPRPPVSCRETLLQKRAGCGASQDHRPTADPISVENGANEGRPPLGLVAWPRLVIWHWSIFTYIGWYIEKIMECVFAQNHIFPFHFFSHTRLSCFFFIFLMTKRLTKWRKSILSCTLEYKKKPVEVLEFTYNTICYYTGAYEWYSCQ